MGQDKLLERWDDGRLPAQAVRDVASEGWRGVTTGIKLKEVVENEVHL